MKNAMYKKRHHMENHTPFYGRNSFLLLEDRKEYSLELIRPEGVFDTKGMLTVSVDGSAVLDADADKCGGVFEAMVMNEILYS